MSKQEEIVTRSLDLEPTHPSEILKFDFMEPLNISTAALALRLKVTRQSVHSFLRETNPTSVTPDMALRLEKCLGVSAKTWLGLQAEYDLWKKRQNNTALNQIERLPELV